MGRYTAVARTDKWMRRFGIDVEEIDQGELVRRSGLVPAAQAVAEGDWLEKNAADIHYDGKKLVFSGRRCGGPSSSPLRAMSPWRASPVWTVPTGCRVTKACFEPYNDEKNESSMHCLLYTSRCV